MTIPNLPVRCIDLGNPAEKSAHDEIVKKVEKMLALQNERQSVKPEEDLDRALYQLIAQAEVMGIR